MTILAGSANSFSAVGNREDLVDRIYNISSVDTPFQAAIDKNKADSTFHEWQRDLLASAASNAQIEGDEVTFSQPTYTTRPGNRCTISYKSVAVTATQDAVRKAGRKKEFLYQIMKRSKELRRDIEFMLTNPTTPTAGTTAVGRVLRSLPGWYGDMTGVPSSSNISRGTSGANGTTSASATDGTQRILTEGLLKTVLQGGWMNGGNPNLIMPGAFNKQSISGFTGNNSRIQDTSDKKLVTAIDVYVSDFGTLKVVPNRFSRDRDLHVLQTDLWALSSLRSMRTEDLAKTGDSTKGFIVTEYTLEARNDSGSGIVADLTTS